MRISAASESTYARPCDYCELIERHRHTSPASSANAHCVCRRVPPTMSRFRLFPSPPQASKQRRSRDEEETLGRDLDRASRRLRQRPRRVRPAGRKAPGVFGHLVEQLVNADEGRAPHARVSLLKLAIQINHCDAAPARSKSSAVGSLAAFSPAMRPKAKHSPIFPPPW